MKASKLRYRQSIPHKQPMMFGIYLPFGMQAQNHFRRKAMKPHSTLPPGFSPMPILSTVGL